MQQTKLPTKSIRPDENQPRKYFAADKMFALKESIKKEGIITPLVVQEMGKDGFLLIDGERRYRAALDLGLKEVPVVIEKPTSKTQRLVRQFQIQEMHEGWTPIEKAHALIALADEMGLSLRETCVLLHINRKDIERYLAFANLSSKDAFVKSEVPLHQAGVINSVVGAVKRLSFNVLNKEVTHDQQKKLELRLIKSIKDGQLVRPTDATRLIDSFTKNPKLIDKYLGDTKVTPDSLFLESKAQGAYALRNLAYACRYVQAHGNRFLETRDVKISPDTLANMKSAAIVLDKVIDLA